ncbi:MAG: glycosyltransferase family 2 protein [Acidobacteria bacterium]|nr:glycosyltransferase family 2 protein [Acidobacteriota bacterium]
MISVLTPAFNEAANLPALYRRLVATMATVGGDWEWVVVDDHSRDDTFGVLAALAADDPRVRGIRLARNSGSHVAITCGLHHVAGDAAVMMAADLQDPPETMTAMLGRWREGAQVVWAVRRVRPGESSHAGFAAAYYWVMRHVVGMKEMPSRGADYFLVDRAVIDAFRRFPERHGSVLAHLTWLGFRQAYVEYDKQPRAAGRSGWTLARKLGLVLDSVTSFTAAPLRLASMAGAGLMVLAAPVGVAGLLLLPAISGILLLVLAAVAVVGGLQLLALGLLGEYVWRGVEEARRRPQFVVEAVVGAGGRQGGAPPAGGP